MVLLVNGCLSLEQYLMWDIFFNHLKTVLETLLPAVTGHSPPGDVERALFALPARLGGLGIINPTCLSSVEFSSSCRITEPLQALLISQSAVYSEDVRTAQISIKSKVYHLKSSNAKSTQADLLQQAPASLQRSIELASEKGASGWLTVLPLQEHGFALHKTAFHDAIALRYGWDPS